LGKLSPDDDELVRGQIIISLLSKDGPSSGNPLAIVGPSGDVRGPSEDDSSEDSLPEGWEERRTDNGRIYYVNHATKSTQWDRPRHPGVVGGSSQATSPHQRHNTHNGNSGDRQAPAGPTRSTTCTNLMNNGHRSRDLAVTASDERRHSTEILSSVGKENTSPTTPVSATTTPGKKNSSSNSSSSSGGRTLEQRQSNFFHILFRYNKIDYY